MTYTLVAGVAIHASATYLATKERLIERMTTTGSSRTDQITTITCSDQGTTQPDNVPAIQAGRPYNLNLGGLFARCTQRYCEVVDARTTVDHSSPDTEALPFGSPLPEPRGPVVTVTDPHPSGQEGYSGYLGPPYADWVTYGSGYTQWTWAVVIVYLNGVHLGATSPRECARQTAPAGEAPGVQPMGPGGSGGF